MADPLWLDSDVIMQVANGDTALEAELNALRNAGTTFLMVPKVREECTVGNPMNEKAAGKNKDILSKPSSQRNQDAIDRLRVQLDTSGSFYTAEDRTRLQERGFMGADGKPLPPQARVQASDSEVLTQVTTSASARGVRLPRIMSLDGGVRQNAIRWGVTAINRSSVPAPAGGGGGGGPTTATSADPWLGPGGTPGFNPGRIANVGMALDLFQNWATQFSMITAAYAAWNAVLVQEAKVIRLQDENPEYPVYIAIYWKIINENNPNLYKSYQFFGIQVQTGGAGKPAALYDSDQKSYLMTIPARKAGGPEKKGATPPARTWRDTFVTVYGYLAGDHTTGGDPEKALQSLNGCPMYDILPILKEIKRADAIAYNKLEQALQWPTVNVGVSRLEAAFFAVRMSANSGDPFIAYKAACKPFAALPNDQQRDIEGFLTGTSGAAQTALANPAGEWTCRVGRFLWVYTFDANNGVTWRDPYNGKNGRGTWKMGDTLMKLTWAGSKSWDNWSLPLNPTAQGGTVSVDGEGIFSLQATRKA